MSTDDLADETVRLQKELDALEAQIENVRVERDQAIVKLRKSGVSAIRIGELVGLQRQRVYKILDREGLKG